MSAKTEKTIYLDIDGVILPYWHKSDCGMVAGPDGQLYSRSDLQPGLEPRWIDSHEYYYPEITKRLGSLAAHIVLASSRSINILFNSGYSQIVDDLGVEDFIHIDRISANKTSYKAEAVINNWQGIVDISAEKRGWSGSRAGLYAHPTTRAIGSRAVWIDDAARPGALETVRSLDVLSDDTLRIIQPISQIGITMTEVDEVETFLR